MYDDLALPIFKIRGQDIFITSDPILPDWTSQKPVKLIVASDSLRFEAPFPEDDNSRGWKELIGGLRYFLKEEVKNPPLVFGWDVKNLISYIKAKTGNEIFNKVIDIRIAESFAGIRDGLPPTNLEDAKSRIAKVKKTGNWAQFLLMYRNIFSPLIKEVVPNMETAELVNFKTKEYLHSHYVIEGTSNGRMKTLKPCRHAYLPHSLTPEDKECLAPLDDLDVFLYLDFKHMEVSMLQWLSKDRELEKFLDGEDIYRRVWKEITQSEPTDDLRERFKRVFLSIIYGAGASSVSKRLGTSIGAARALIERIERKFRVATAWSKGQSVDTHGVYTDHFGRKRYFAENFEYKVRNFAVSAPASMVCLHKLVDLSSKLELGKVVFHVHDGYCILTNRNRSHHTCRFAKQILEAENDLYPGLKLKVDAQIGSRLNSLVQV